MEELIYWIVVGVALVILAVASIVSRRPEHRDKVERDRNRWGGGHLR